MPSEGQGSVTLWLTSLRAGEIDAAQLLWERYFSRLVRSAREKLRQAHNRGLEADEEDAALDAFERKAIDQVRRARRLKRGGGRVRSEADLDAGDQSDAPAGLDRIVGPEPSPEFAAMVAERLHHLLDALGDDELRQIATWKLEGHTIDEIAAKLGCARRTVARRLELIRTLWQPESL
jgi:hypothetical protein